MKIDASKRLRVLATDPEKLNPFGNNVDVPVSQLKVHPAKPADPEMGAKLTALANKIVAILKDCDDELANPKIQKTNTGVSIVLGKSTCLDMQALQAIARAMKAYNSKDGAILFLDVTKGKLVMEVSDATTLGL